MTEWWRLLRVVDRPAVITAAAGIVLGVLIFLRVLEPEASAKERGLVAGLMSVGFIVIGSVLRRTLRPMTTPSRTSR